MMIMSEMVVTGVLDIKVTVLVSAESCSVNSVTLSVELTTLSEKVSRSLGPSRSKSKL